MKDRKYELNRFSIYDSTAVQRHHRLTADFLLQGQTIRRGNVGRVADNHVERDFRHGSEQIPLMQGDGRAKQFRVFRRDRQRIGG